MNIKELYRAKNFEPTATVELTYDEVRFVSNILCEMSKMEKITREYSNFNIMRKRFLELATLMKYGTIPAFELGVMHDLITEETEDV